MTNQKTIEVVKDEVAKEHTYPTGKKCESWNGFFNFYSSTDQKQHLERAIDMIVQLYHQRLCEEAGRELPSDGETYAELEGLRHTNFSRGYQRGYLDGSNSMKEKASALLAIKQGEIEKIREDLYAEQEIIGEERVNSIKHFNNLKSQLEAKDKDMDVKNGTLKAQETLIELLKFQLQESKAEVEKKAIDFAEWICNDCVRTKQDGEYEIWAKGTNMFYIDNYGNKTEMTITELYAKYKSQLTEDKNKPR